ncbi:MAG TPA: DUF5661 family protein [Candidatus Nitrosotenuis sp.]|nr:DUF5661 family protein [Candidatus Nitrosotenuis sp.]
MTKFSLKDAKEIGQKIGIDWKKSKFDVNQFLIGINVELEHGMRDPETNVTGDDPIMTGKIARAHLNEFPDYYDRLEKLEKEADKAWKKSK